MNSEIIKMDYEIIQQAMNSPYVITSAIVSATGLAGLLIGYVSGRNNIKRAEFQRDIEVAREATRKSEYETIRQQALVSVDIRRLELDNADSEHKRTLEKMALQREYQIEDDKKDYERRLTEEQKEREQQIQEVHSSHVRQLELEQSQKDTHEQMLQRKMKLAERLSGFIQPFQEYLNVMKQFIQNGVTDPDYENLRQEYRTKLVEDWQKGVEDEGELFSADLDEVEEQINRLEKLKYPPRELRQPQLPSEIRGLFEKLADE